MCIRDSGYAVAYPLGVVGCILALLALKIFMRINTQKEEEDAEHGLGHLPVSYTHLMDNSGILATHPTVFVYGDK